jgi:holliday junction DNA helicase RuvA
MIAHLEGCVAANGPTRLVLDAGGVGFLVLIPLSSYDPSLKPGDRTRLWTHLHVRDDALVLYGFGTESEREWFELLISVSGIGPPMARQILSGVTVGELRRLIGSGDAKGLTRIKGIGSKLAQRLVLELSDRVDGAASGRNEKDTGSTATEEAVTALAGLGADSNRARKAVADVLKQEGDGLPVEEIIRRALRRM